jgi:hypothetical protein
VAEENSRGL